MQIPGRKRLTAIFCGEREIGRLSSEDLCRLSAFWGIILQIRGKNFLGDGFGCFPGPTIRTWAPGMGRIPQERPSVAKARTLSCRTYGTTDVVPFQNLAFFRRLRSLTLLLQMVEEGD